MQQRLALMIAAAVPHVCAGQPIFPGAKYAAGDGPTGIAVADLNADAAPDIIVANWQSNDVSVFLGAGDGTSPLIN